MLNLYTRLCSETATGDIFVQFLQALVACMILSRLPIDDDERVLYASLRSQVPGSLGSVCDPRARRLRLHVVDGENPYNTGDTSHRSSPSYLIHLITLYIWT